jgi:hypothetical protein
MPFATFAVYAAILEASARHDVKKTGEMSCDAGSRRIRIEPGSCNGGCERPQTSLEIVPLIETSSSQDERFFRND